MFHEMLFIMNPLIKDHNDTVLAVNSEPKTLRGKEEEIKVRHSQAEAGWGALPPDYVRWVGLWGRHPSDRAGNKF